MATIRGDITVKPHVQAWSDFLESQLGTLSFGTYPGHSPPEGPTQAEDIFTPDNPSGWALQDRICALARVHAKRFGIRYVIRREQIWNIERDDEGWRWQSHKGNRRLDHYDHVHITFYATAPGPFGAQPPATDNPHMREEAMFLFSTSKNIQGGSFWFVTSGIAHRMHTPSDVEQLVKKGIPNLGEMSESFLNVFEKRG